MNPPAKMTRDEIFVEVKRTLIELFSIEESRITMKSGVFTQLELDSIDAVDLVARLQDLIGQRITEAEMRQVRTVGDMVDIVERYLEKPAAAAPSAE
jgi:acyl carrier protein